MKEFVSRMIEEHAQLVIRIQNLHNYVYSDKSEQDNKVEFANKCIQLSAMKKYEEALRARLENQNIAIDDNGNYFEKVAQIEQVIPSTNNDVNNPSSKSENEDEGKKE